MTLADIATFRPAPSAPASEPNGWGIAGLDTNFLADARTQVVAGTLLGRPASVRFTPIGYAWTYGDGSARTTTSAGATWQRSGAREFDPTPSSHVYAAPGDYSAQLTVLYSAAYSWDGSAFVPIDGTVSAPAGAIPVRIVVESTVLVGGQCTPGSTAPGC